MGDIFSNNFLVHMPPEQFQIFFESVINSIVDNNSVYHYHMIYTSWNVENIPLGYRNFQELFIESASVLKSIDNSFYEPTFREVVMTDLYSTTATLAQNALVEQHINITAILTGFSWGDVSQQVLSGVQWIIVNRIYVGSAVTIGIATWGILRQPISDWIGGILNPPRAIVDIQPIIDLQGNRGQFISPIPVNVPVPSQPYIIETLPIDGTPTIGLPIDTILYLGENASSIGVATVIVSIFVFALKKGGTIKIFSFFGR